MKNLIFRRIVDSDSEQINLLISKVWRTAYKHIFPIEVFEDREKNLKERIEKFKQNINSTGYVGFVAVDGEKIVAVASGSTISKYQHFADLQYADFIALYIDEKYQHQGIGKILFSLVKNEFLKQGYNKMVIGVFKDNLKARKAYEKWGGKLFDLELPFLRLGKTYLEVFMFLKTNF